MSEYNKQMQRFNVGEDCPVFDGLYEFCQLSAGGSVAAAVKLNKQVRKTKWGNKAPFYGLIFVAGFRNLH